MTNGDCFSTWSFMDPTFIDIIVYAKPDAELVSMHEHLVLPVRAICDEAYACICHFHHFSLCDVCQDLNFKYNRKITSLVVMAEGHLWCKKPIKAILPPFASLLYHSHSLVPK